jgi:hypothetical protein
MKRASLLASFFTLAIILGIGVGCARKPDDAKISSDIQSKFSEDSGLSSKQLTVQAHDGVVTLAGMVDNDAQRLAASRQAATVEGVRTVVNNLQVGSGPAATAKAASKPPMQASTQPVLKAKPAPGKKSSKARADDSGAAGDSANDSNPDETSVSNQDPPDAAAQAPPPPDNTQAPPSPKRLIIDQGTQVSVRLIDPIDSERNQTGDAFHATLNAALTSDGEEAVPAGVELTGHLVEVKSAGKFAGQSAVVLQLDSLSLAGKTYSLQTDQYRKEGSSRGKNTAEKVGGGAIIGGIIGAIAGGGKGAAIGTAAGAGVGGGVQAASKGQQIKLPSETVLNFVLQEPIEVVPAPAADSNRPKLGDSQ